MRRVVPWVLTAAAVLAISSTVGVPTRAAGAAEPGYRTQSLHFAVTVGPAGDQRQCDIVGDLYTPAGVSAQQPAPAILTTNGFGGSAASQTPFAQRYAARGYVVLSYSGLGFGGSGCKITLDDPDYDGLAASQLVSFLGGAPGIAFTDAEHTDPLPALDYVLRDPVDHRGVAQRHDPRMGMWGGSYGGQVQFAVASLDARVDVLNPQITWHDLSYSLGPNNAAPGGVTGAGGTAGVTKLTWPTTFSAIGVFNGVQYAQQDPQRLVGCPNFADFVCPALVSAGATGYLRPEDIAKLRHASVASYLPRITIPVLLIQGELDTLFNLNESIATYQALRRQHTPVALLWRYNGHSGGTPSAAGAAYEERRVQDWFDHYLKDADVSTGPGFAYYQDWSGTVATAPSYPVGKPQRLYLSGDDLVSGGIRPGSQSFSTPPAGAPSTLGNLDVVGSQVEMPLDNPDVNLPGTFASWTGAPLTAPVTVVGTPTLDVKVSAPTAALSQASGPGGQLVLFAKLYDVDTDGTARLINGLVAPVRISDVTRSVRITLPGIAHRFATGHRIALYLAGGDTNYRGGLAATPVTVSTGSSGQVLTLPVR
ncbi:MAG TPA: CocE/NonD family hydrolase [Jatrophihabitans sp.]|uniref:CocE/NonD family hydrolase n=1 Tax=Jatrophihabitans sp. TaxID=1932789 RepID=UPI002F1FFD5C